MIEGDRDLRTATTMIDSRQSTTSRPLAVGGGISPIAVVFAFELLERARNPWQDIWRAALVAPLDDPKGSHCDMLGPA